uniref:Sulfate ABC transporter ATP-binding subunit CysA n=1 Tax=Olisthodiscus luteus TaxID=83000 RepID=A0A7U0LZ33_OLILU|nr:sulfate ABC transporter ATP-binding subunit CysA [Olisthodiscus luteus]
MIMELKTSKLKNILYGICVWLVYFQRISAFSPKVYTQLSQKTSNLVTHATPDTAKEENPFRKKISADIRIKGVSKHYPEPRQPGKVFVAVDNVSLDIESGGLVALVGASGSGKSTLLRMIAGLESLSSGQIIIDGQDASNVPPQARNIGMVFQSYALFPHMTVAENIAFGLKIKRYSRKVVRERVAELLDVVQLTDFAQRMPHQLSGGQRQRVGLARALAPAPRVLLLDEPFGALDAKVRRSLRGWLRKLHADVGVTTVFVTHDQQEALEIAKTVVVMNQGRIEQIGTPMEIYDAPRNPFVMQFMGDVSTIEKSEYLTKVLTDVETEGIEIGDGKSGAAGAQLSAQDVAVAEAKLQMEGEVGAIGQLLVRPHDIIVHKRRIDNITLPGTVSNVLFLGFEIQMGVFLTDGQEIIARVPKDRYKALGMPTRGEEVFIEIKSRGINVDTIEYMI